MWVLALLLSSMIAGSLACSEAHCKDPALYHELIETKFLPNKEQLKTLCPKIMTFIECGKEFFACSGQSLDEMATSLDERVAGNAKLMLGGISLINDVCDEDSSFHNDYVGSADCFRDSIEIAQTKCKDDVLKPIEGFFGETFGGYPTVNQFGEEVSAEVSCLKDLYEIACIVDNLGDSCGSVAQRIAVTALEKMKAFVKSQVCLDVENAADLKSRFLDFLELDEKRRSNFQGVFDLLKRRR